MLTLPIYMRGSSYYLHTRINGKQVKRSLSTNDRLTAIIRASQLLQSSLMSRIKTFEIDLSRGILKADGADDHARMMEALAMLKQAPMASSTPLPYTSEPLPKANTKTGLKLLELVDKFFSLKSQLKPATVTSYTNTAQELANFLDNPYINNIRISCITRYQESLTEKNKPRTIDNKMAALRTLFNFAIKQGYFFNDNPAQDRVIMKEKDKLKTQYGIFKDEEIKKIYHSDFLRTAKKNDKDYYYSLMIAFYTACRISEVTGLEKKQFKVTESGVNYISIIDAKTPAGVRDIPLPQALFDDGLGDFIKDKKGQVFKYPIRLGKGSGNAVGKKFKRHMLEVGIDEDKLVFHSLRKFLNNYLFKEGLKYEPRCQMLGHETTGDTNIELYTHIYTPDELAKEIKPYLTKLHILSGLLQTDFK